jgi:hypothetical protein
MSRSDSARPSPDPLVVLRDLRGRVRQLLQGLSEEQAATSVPACPGQSVRDVVAHLSTAPAAVPCSPDVAEEARGRSTSELLDLWDAAHDRLHSASPDDVLGVLVDAVTHEHDLRAALDLPGARADASVILALDVLAAGLSERVAAAGLPGLRVTVEQWGALAGRPPATRCLVADRFEFVRGMAGRRSVAQVERWNWDAAPGAYLNVISCRGPLPTQDFRERDPRVPEHMRHLDLTH